jgi:hypothetical protein
MFNLFICPPVISHNLASPYCKRTRCLCDLFVETSTISVYNEKRLLVFDTCRLPLKLVVSAQAGVKNGNLFAVHTAFFLAVLVLRLSKSVQIVPHFIIDKFEDFILETLRCVLAETNFNLIRGRINPIYQFKRGLFALTRRGH